MDDIFNSWNYPDAKPSFTSIINLLNEFMPIPERIHYNPFEPIDICDLTLGNYIYYVIFWENYFVTLELSNPNTPNISWSCRSSGKVVLFRNIDDLVNYLKTKIKSDKY